MKKLKVMIIAPVVLPLSSNLKYGGTERVIMSLVEKLEGKVDYVVAASKDSKIKNLIHSNQNSLWKHKANNLRIVNFTAAQEKHIRFCLKYAQEHGIDVIHDNADLVNSKAYKMSNIDIPVISTLHGDLNMRFWRRYNLWKKLQKEKRLYFSAISYSQKEKFEKYAKIIVAGVVHNGISVKTYPYVGKKQNYLFWIGRIAKDKGTDLAIKLAKLSKKPLIIAGDVHSVNRKFYIKHVKPYITRLLDGKNESEWEKERNKLVAAISRNENIINPGEILFIGPVNDSQKKTLYSNALACIALNRWDEPFGLFLPESMACGTPVIGTRLGALPEVIVHNQTGFLVDIHKKHHGVAAEQHVVSRAANYVKQLNEIKPINCRRHAEKFFDSKMMANSYIKLYKMVRKDGQIKDAKWRQYTVSGGTTELPEELYS